MGFFDPNPAFQASVIASSLFAAFVGLHVFIYKKFLANKTQAPKSKNILTTPGWNKVIALFGCLMALPLIFYSYSIKAGLGYSEQVYTMVGANIDEVRFMVDQRIAYLASPQLISLHMWFNSGALLVGVFQFLYGYKIRNPFLHRILGSIYVAGFTIGCTFAIMHLPKWGYGRFEDNNFGSTLAFIAMGFAVCLPAYVAVYQIVVNRDYLAHREWMSRSISAALGAAVLYRLAIMRLDLFSPQNQYTYYLLSGFMSWTFALFACEIYIQKQRQNRLALVWKSLGHKDINTLNRLLSSKHHDELARFQKVQDKNVVQHIAHSQKGQSNENKVL